MPMETSEIRKCLLAISVAKPRQNAKLILKNYMLYIYGNIHCSISFCKNVIKTATSLPSCELHLFTHFSCFYEYIVTTNDVHKNTQVQFYIQLYVYLSIFQSVCGISCWPHADQNLPKLHERLNRSDLTDTPTITNLSLLFHQLIKPHLMLSKLIT